MGVRWLVNAVLLTLPVGGTIGVLSGIDAVRSANGQKSLFADSALEPEMGTSTGPAQNAPAAGPKAPTTVNPKDNRVTIGRYCGRYDKVEPASVGTEYMISTNQWAYENGTSMCMNVTSFNNGSYATPSTAPQFFVTWQYPVGPITQPVHAYPNIQPVGDMMPVLLPSLSQINLDFDWTYGVGNEPVAATDMAALVADAANANVALDMFFDIDKDASKDTGLAGLEIMVWFATIGTAAQPIGLDAGSVDVQVIDGVSFDLFTGKNGRNQTVFTWSASTPAEFFTGDIMPLIDRLTQIPGTDFDTTNLYLGHLGFGTEAFSATNNVTFSVSKLAIDLVLA